MVNCKLVEPFSGIEAAPNALMITGGATTVILAVLLGAPGPVSLELTGPLVLFFTPAVVPCTSTESVHEALPERVPADRPTEPEPPTALGVPPHVLLTLGVDATTSPDGRLSVNASPVSEVPLGLLMVKVKEVLPFSGILAAPNALEMVGGASTVRFAEALLPVPPLVELTAPVVLV